MYKMIISAHETMINVGSCKMYRYDFLCMRMLISAVHESFETME